MSLEDLGLRDLGRLAKVDQTGLPTFGFSVLGDFATQHFVTCLRGLAVRSGFSLDVFEADYDQIEMQVADPQSELYAHHNDAVLVAQCTERLWQRFCNLPDGERRGFAELVAGEVASRWQAISLRTGAPVLQTTFAYDNDRAFGSYGLRAPDSFAYQLQRLNCLLSEAAAASGKVYLVDVNAVRARYGSDFRDDRMWYIAKMPFSLAALPSVASEVMHVVCALRGQVAKCVVVDLDNTLWGGSSETTASRAYRSASWATVRPT